MSAIQIINNTTTTPVLSSDNETSTNVETKVKTVRTKKPTLPAKLQKFAAFGYAFTKSLAAANVISEENLEAAYGQLMLFSPVEEQTRFYQNFLDQSADTLKTMRKFVVQHNKPVKAPKARATKAAAAPKEPKAAKEPKTKTKPIISTISNTTGSSSDETAAAAATTTTTTATTVSDEVKIAPVKKSRKKNVNVATDAKDDIIGQLVAAANNIETVASADAATTVAVVAATTTNTPVDVVVVADKPKKQRKPKTVEVAPATVPVEVAATVAATVPVEVAATAAAAAAASTDAVVDDKPKKQRKPKTVAPTDASATAAPAAAAAAADTVVADKAKKQRKPKTVEAVVAAPATTTPAAEEDDDEVIHTREFVFDQQYYLIDQATNFLYNPTSFDHVANFNPETNDIAFI